MTMIRDATETNRTRRMRLVNTLIGPLQRTPTIQASIARIIALGSLTPLDAITFGFLARSNGDNNCSITAMDNVLTSPDNPWTADDVGKTIHVQGAGVAAATLTTTIETFNNPGSIVLGAQASYTVAADKTSVSGVAVWGDDFAVDLDAETKLDPDGDKRKGGSLNVHVDNAPNNVWPYRAVQVGFEGQSIPMLATDGILEIRSAYNAGATLPVTGTNGQIIILKIRTEINAIFETPNGGAPIGGSADESGWYTEMYRCGNTNDWEFVGVMHGRDLLSMSGKLRFGPGAYTSGALDYQQAAFAGTKAGATHINSFDGVITLLAGVDGASVLLPRILGPNESIISHSTPGGAMFFIRNITAYTIRVFPNGPNTIDETGSTTGVILPPFSGALFHARVNPTVEGRWITFGLQAAGGGGGIAPSILTDKGSIISATAPSTPAELLVGVDGAVLTADSAAGTGLDWKVPPVGIYPALVEDVAAFVGGGAGSATALDATKRFHHVTGGSSAADNSIALPTGEEVGAYHQIFNDSDFPIRLYAPGTGDTIGVYNGSTGVNIPARNSVIAHCHTHTSGIHGHRVWAIMGPQMGPDIRVIEADATLEDNLGGLLVIVGTTVAPYTITLPSGPRNSQRITIKRFGANTVTIGRNSQNINGVAADITLTADHQTVELVFYAGNWFSVSEYATPVAPSPALTETVVSSAINYAVLSTDQNVLIDTTAGNVSAQLEAAPAQGRKVTIKNIGTGANTMTIDRNGNNIEGAAADVTTITPGESFTLIYDATYKWAVI